MSCIGTLSFDANPQKGLTLHHASRDKHRNDIAVDAGRERLADNLIIGAGSRRCSHALAAGVGRQEIAARDGAADLRSDGCPELYVNIGRP